MTEIAELAIGVGLPVFPCRADKRPACPHGFKDAAIATEAVRELWRHWPGPLIGVPTGKASGLFVLDIDPDGIDWLDMVCRGGRLNVTRVHRTRRGGFHLVYRLPKEPLPNSAGKLARGIDTRGEGGYVIWPPSEGYEVVEDSPVAALPRWLERRLRAPGQAEAEPGTTAAFAGGWRGGSRSQALERFVALSREGERNQRLFWAACRAAETGDCQLGRRLIAAARACGLGEIEARRTVESAFKMAG
ncbi:MAG: bifunctional DNA primase/polymerase [Alphaproteobacteria bacterium]|nr:bifunctional DNA primase/polymerase [Alphaproteobacteria bacterium]MBV9374076.1 bifunctional DNA primase/polymerase [Alphaproteobacteria bacterium]